MPAADTQPCPIATFAIAVRGGRRFTLRRMRHASPRPGGLARRAALLAVLSLRLCAARALPEAEGVWVGTWAASPQAIEPKDEAPAPGLKGDTLRQVVHVSIGGGPVRLRFSNAFGSGAVVIAAVDVAAAGPDGSIRQESRRAALFGGSPSVVLEPGRLRLSDALPLQLLPLSDLQVTIRFGDVPARMTGHSGARCTSYLAAGNQVGSALLDRPVGVPHWYVLSGADVMSRQGAASAAILGDSITDGRGSTQDGNRRWTDDLARRLQGDPRTRRVGILNEGIGGNRLLHDGLGPSGLSRLGRDVLDQSAVRWLVVLEGVNDLGTAPAGRAEAVARNLIEAYRQVVGRAHERGIRVYGGTLTPFGGSFYSRPDTEAAREAVNRWIRTGGGFDAVIDFDAAVRDRAEPSRLSPPLDSGDHLHLSDRGYERMAEAVDLSLFLPGRRPAPSPP